MQEIAPGLKYGNGQTGLSASHCTGSLALGRDLMFDVSGTGPA